MGWQRFPYLMPSEALAGAWRWCPPGPVHVSTIQDVPRYSTEIAAAWEVVAKVREWPEFNLFDLSTNLFAQPWTAMFGGTVSATGETAPLAICRAALAALSAPSGAAVPRTEEG